ncbi:MAG: EF2563 family selenium-dependent molybdenum hydroxylase system protein [Myxococcales bacterium]|nr:EF2563 family selenium-dependent molybdenum hydroxylase system protein [Myxococcales bacterium]
MTRPSSTAHASRPSDATAPPLAIGSTLPPVVLLRGAGDLGSGVAVALAQAGVPLVIVDLPRPTGLRLTASLSAAALSGEAKVAGVTATRCESEPELLAAMARGHVPLWTADEHALRARVQLRALVDARMRGLTDRRVSRDDAPVVIALGPGHCAGVHCHYVIETNRGPDLGRVIKRGPPERHTGLPGLVAGERARRLVRAPLGGRVRRRAQIGDRVAAGEVVAEVDGAPALAAIDGMVRGLKLDGIVVARGDKIGDIDPRCDRSLLAMPSDKSERIGQAVLNALRAAEAEANALEHESVENTCT